MNVSISAQLGLPATVHLDQGLVELISSRPPWLPFTLFSQLQIARHALSIGTIPASGSLSTLGSFFEIELRIVEEQSTAFWSPTDRIIFLGTKLMLYICTREATSSWWLINGYLTATSIVQVAASGDFPWAYAPLRIHKIVLNAVCLLLLLKCTRYRHPISTDTFALNNLICRGRELLSQLPTSSGDFISRVLMVVDLLSDVSGRPRSENDLEKLLVIKTRMGANIALSAAKFAREESMRMQEGIGNQTLLNPSELAGMEDLDMLLDMDWGLE
ncbi:uncharacterized protein ACLA_053200 [Aspergillus clavatus NRRL 1]|uniref:Transcription factor domain-containing protein n=1 Tax=Aspergillus clavatus (strain ATCC 1007 / CBS 513.65 / DSM 816 / NCTC 3887 / NRRL 1 / QM 1276 / 107) TaxID=344612 RepID=A1CIZ1_ASPCL|nr:uncharacterized protein ACLA_053200 [Aspergillus clavatus NRRL 1]EAW10846.1 hypothetical protein ACLA_053200 [Aspergillus clavatus NRRL 1]